MTTTPTNAWISLAGVLVALATNIVWQVARCRAARGNNLLGTTVSGFIAGLGVLVIWEAVQWRGKIVTAAASMDVLGVDLPLYLCLGYCYANLVLVGRASIRIRIYQEICQSPAGLSLAKLREIYNEMWLLHSRIQRLSESGDICECGGLYRANRRRLVWIANLIFALKALVLRSERQ